MRSLLELPWLSLLTRMVVGGIFVFSSVEKTANPNAFALLIDNYRLFPHEVSLILASFLPWMELVCGMAILSGVGHRGGGLAAGTLTFGFTIAVVSGLLRGLDISCGCYTLDPDVGKIGWMKVIENTGLLLLSVFLVYSSGDRWTLDRLFNRSSITEASVS